MVTAITRTIRKAKPTQGAETTGYGFQVGKTGWRGQKKFL